MKKPISHAIVIAGFIGFLAGAITVSVVPVRPVHAKNPKSVAQTVEARSFVLVDEAGNKRGEWILDKSGQPSLRMFDEQGRVTWDTNLRIVPLKK